MAKEYRILVTTADRYMRSILPFKWLLDKYWPDPPDVVLGGFTPPDFDLPNGVEFHSIGPMSDYPVDRWSDAFIKFLHEVDDEVFLYMLEDMWIIKPVYERCVAMAYDYMKQFKYVARLDLTGDRLNSGGAALYGKLGHIDLIWSDPNSQYHMSTMPAFWRKEHLLRILVPGETPWQLELQGTPRLSAMRDELVVLGTAAWPLRNTLAFRGGDTSKLLLDEIDPQDIKEMRGLGLLEGLG